MRHAQDCEVDGCRHPATAVVKNRDTIFNEAVVVCMLHRSRKHVATHRRLVPRYGLHDTRSTVTPSAHNVEAMQPSPRPVSFSVPTGPLRGVRSQAWILSHEQRSSACAPVSQNCAPADSQRPSPAEKVGRSWRIRASDLPCNRSPGMSDVIYLDDNASNPMHPAVADAMTAAMQNLSGNASSSHAAGVLARKAVEDARGQLAELLDVASSELVFTSGATESNNLPS